MVNDGFLFPVGESLPNLMLVKRHRSRHLSSIDSSYSR